MDKIQAIATKIRDFFVNIDCTTEDEFGSDSNCEMDDNLIIGDDFHRQEWLVGYTVPGGTHDSVTRSMIDLFGEPEKKCYRSDLKVNVNNWDVDKVHIVQVRPGPEPDHPHPEVPETVKVTDDLG